MTEFYSAEMWRTLPPLSVLGNSSLSYGTKKKPHIFEFFVLLPHSYSRFIEFLLQKINKQIKLHSAPLSSDEFNFQSDVRLHLGRQLFRQPRPVWIRRRGTCTDVSEHLPQTSVADSPRVDSGPTVSADPRSRRSDGASSTRWPHISKASVSSITATSLTQ